jgi:hypothetical protein
MKSFSELTGKEKSIELIRWLLVPCVSVLIGLVIPRLITDLLWWPIITRIHLSRIGPVSHWKMEASRLLLVSIVLGAAFVVAGAKMAPKARVTTGFLLGTFWTLYWFYSDVLVVPHRDGFSYVRAFFATLSAASGVGFIAYSEKRLLREASRPDDLTT